MFHVKHFLTLYRSIYYNTAIYYVSIYLMIDLFEILYLILGLTPTSWIIFFIYKGQLFYLSILIISGLISCISLEYGGLFGWIARHFLPISIAYFIYLIRDLLYNAYFRFDSEKIKTKETSRNNPVKNIINNPVKDQVESAIKDVPENMIKDVPNNTIKHYIENTIKNITDNAVKAVKTIESKKNTILLPSTNLLVTPKYQKLYTVDRREELLTVLKSFGIEGEVHGVQAGPAVTLYNFEPVAGLKISRVVGLADDIARSMSARSVRIAKVPGKNFIGIEISNQHQATVYFKDMLQNAGFENAVLPLALGKDIAGIPMVEDLSKMPHLLVAGTTGSGKSVVVHSMLLSLLYKLNYEQLKLLLIDPKMLEFTPYRDIPHLLHPVVTDPKEAITALKWVINEMVRRYKDMSDKGVRNILGHNQQFPAMPYIVVVVDEMADLMLVAGKEVELAVQRLAQMGRAAGIHIIVATQRPSVDVITGTVKANFPSRISLKVITKIDSRTILGDQGAEQLLGRGDMLYMGGSGGIVRAHGPFVTEDEVNHVADFLRSLSEPQYVDDLTVDNSEEGTSNTNSRNDKIDERYNEAVACVYRTGKASTSHLITHMGLGYNRARRIIDKMEEEGIISAPQGSQSVRQIFHPK